MVLAADYPLLNIIWTMLVFFAFVIWFSILITVLRDLYHRHDLSGWSKAAWTLFMIVFPFLGVLVYLGIHGKGMAERNLEAVQARADLADTRRGGGNAAGEIAKAKELLDGGAITQAEFDQIKSQALA